MSASNALLVCIALTGLVKADNMRSKFLGTTGTLRLDDLRVSMLEEITQALGEGNRVTEDRLAGIEAALRPMYKAMPKNEYGHLEHSAVSYLLHRLFVQRHGMFLKGVEPTNNWNGLNTSAIFEDKVSTYVQSMFEERLNGRGLGLHELAILAATLEHIIHDESQERLRQSYQAHDFELERQLSETEGQEVIETSLALFILGAKSPKDIPTIRKVIARAYPGWAATQEFAGEVNRNVTNANKNDPSFTPGKLTFAATAKVVEEIGERFGRWQDGECRDLKNALVKMEENDNGRVLLKDFYGHALDGAWQFTESVEYLRELGALDESNPDRKSVMIPNYVNAPSNCIASSGIYSLCCINECEDLMGHVEREVAEPEATTASIIDAVTRLSSSTVSSPRDISDELRNRLGEIADHHNGHVPLHGRLFAQWMHHAFPRECPYPHKSGTTNPMTPDEWMKAQNSPESITEQDMLFHTKATHESTSADETKLTWTMEEELVVAKPKVKARSGFASLLMIVASAGVFVAMFATMGKAVTETLETTLGGKKEKSYSQGSMFNGKEHII